MGRTIITKKKKTNKTDRKASSLVYMCVSHVYYVNVVVFFGYGQGFHA